MPTHSLQPSNRFVEHLLLLAKGPSDVRPTSLDAVIEHLMWNRNNSAAAWKVSTELHTVAVTQWPYIGGHEVRAAWQDGIEPD